MKDVTKITDRLINERLCFLRGWRELSAQQINELASAYSLVLIAQRKMKKKEKALASCVKKGLPRTRSANLLAEYYKAEAEENESNLHYLCLLAMMLVEVWDCEVLNVNMMKAVYRSSVMIERHTDMRKIAIALASKKKIFT